MGFYYLTMKKALAEFIHKILTKPNPEPKVLYHLGIITLVVCLYKVLLYIIYGVLTTDVDIWYKFLVYTAVWASYTYFLVIYRQKLKSKSKPCKIDYSLSSPNMRDALSMKRFIKWVFFFTVWTIVRCYFFLMDLLHYSLKKILILLPSRVHIYLQEKQVILHMLH